MTNLKLSSKMHILIAVSVAIVAIGLAVGLICQFIANGYFNFGAEYKSYNSVVVDYAYVEFGSEDKVIELCDEQFESAGVSYYSCVSGETDQGGEITFKFAKSVSADSIKSAVTKISEKLGADGAESLSVASFHELDTLLGGGKTLIYASIALASAAAFQFLYFLIRYKFTMAFAAILANVHNLAIYVSLLSITRIPVGSSAVVFGALTVVITMIGCGIMFGRMRRNLKDEKFAALDVNEQVDTCAASSFVNLSVIAVFIVAAAVVILVLMAISSLSVAFVGTPVVLAVLSAVSALYGTAFFTPSVYSRFKRIGDNFKPAKKS